MSNPASASVRPLRRILRRLAVPGVLVLAGLCLVLGTGVTATAEEKVAPPAKLDPAGLEARIELGRRLFFEPLASPSGRRSCASCHEPDHGFSDPKRVSDDDFGKTRRHSQAILDTAHNPSAHWDGEFKDVADLVSARLSTTPFSGSYGGRGGMPSFVVNGKLEVEIAQAGAKKDEKPAEEKSGAEAVGELLRQIFKMRQASPPVQVKFGSHIVASTKVPTNLMESGRYDEGFKAAFGSSEITFERLGKALDAFCKTIESTESPYDRFRAGDENALSASAKRGLHLFEGAAGCAQCHLTTVPAGSDKPLFTDYGFHNTGLSIEDAVAGKDRAGNNAAMIRLLVQANPELRKKMAKQKFNRGLADLMADAGHMAVSLKPEHHRAFKTPTLRDVAKRGPYMHNGSLKTLEDVVRFYAKGAGKDSQKDKLLKPFEATDRDVADLVAFLKALSGDERPGLARKAWSKRARTTRLRFVDHEARPMQGLAVRVEPAGDVLPGEGAEPLTLTTDKGGWIRFEPGARTHSKLELPGGILPIGGSLVPDTCGQIAVQVPVKGRMKLTLTFSKDHAVPDKVLAHHHGMLKGRDIRFKAGDNGLFFLGGQRAVPTTFVRTGVVQVGDTQVARYEGWVRSNVQPQVVLMVPGIFDGKKKHRPSLVLAAGEEMRLDLSSF